MEVVGFFPTSPMCSMCYVP